MHELHLNEKTQKEQFKVMKTHLTQPSYTFLCNHYSKICLPSKYNKKIVYGYAMNPLTQSMSCRIPDL